MYLQVLASFSMSFFNQKKVKEVLGDINLAEELKSGVSIADLPEKLQGEAASHLANLDELRARVFTDEIFDLKI